MAGQCTHPRRGIVTTHPNGEPVRDGGHAARNCCDRPDCIAAAVAWIGRKAHLPGFYSPDPQPTRSPR